MAHLTDNYRVDEEKVLIDNIPCLRLTPRRVEGKYPSIIFYHGLASNKESQRIRAYMLAFAGYQVLIPDAIHHGEREPKETEELELIAKYFWEAILTSVGEADQLLKALIEDYQADPDNIYVTGHSMGGFISAGVFAHNPRIKGAAPMNGSFNWKRSGEVLLESMGLDKDVFSLKDQETIDRLDPVNYRDNMVKRQILILHGQVDPEVNIAPQREFYQLMKEDASRDYSIDMIEYENLGHFVTTGMIEDLIKWLKEGE